MICREDCWGNTQVCCTAVRPECCGRHVTSIERAATSLHSADNAAQTQKETWQHSRTSRLQVAEWHQACTKRVLLESDSASELSVSQLHWFPQDPQETWQGRPVVKLVISSIVISVDGCSLTLCLRRLLRLSVMTTSEFWTTRPVLNRAFQYLGKYDWFIFILTEFEYNKKACHRRVLTWFVAVCPVAERLVLRRQQ